MHAMVRSAVLGTWILAGAAQASLVRIDTATSFAGPQASADDYRSVVTAAVTGAGAHSAIVPLYDNLSNHGVFGSGNSQIAYRFTVEFAVSAAQAGTWGLRAGVDFGLGGALFLDGVALAYNPSDMWWAYSYGSPAGSFQLPAVAMSQGDHTLQIYGLENCCDGGQQAQFSLNGAPYTTFGSADGLTVSPVPEPDAAALMLAGLAGAGLWARRRGQPALRG